MPQLRRATYSGGSVGTSISTMLRRREYKKAYGFTLNTALVGESTRAGMIEGAEIWNKGQLRELVKYNQDVQPGRSSMMEEGTGNGGWPLERRNLEGDVPRTGRCKSLTISLDGWDARRPMTSSLGHTTGGTSVQSQRTSAGRRRCAWPAWLRWARCVPDEIAGDARRVPQRLLRLGHKRPRCALNATSRRTCRSYRPHLVMVRPLDTSPAFH